MTESLPAVVLGFVLVIGFLVALGAAAMTWGVDSRELLAHDPTG
jgi:hypothetical protein